MTISFARHQFPPVIIRHAVWLYVRFTLSYRDVEDLLAERGLDVSYETVRRKHLQHPAPSHLPPHAPRPPRRSVPNVASRHRGVSQNWNFQIAGGQIQFS